jgi:hypothetical protein
VKDEARNILLQAVREHREAALSSRARCLSLLKDYGGNDHPEVVMLADCVEHHVAQRLVEYTGKSITLEVIETMAEYLHAKAFYAFEHSEWAVESWALALNVGVPAKVGGLRRSAQVVFEYGEEDHEAYRRYGSTPFDLTDQERRFLHAVAALIALLGAAFVADRWWAQALAFAFFWASLFYAVIGIFWVCEWVMKKLPAMALAQTAPPGRFTIKISSQGILEKSPAGSRLRSWDLMRSLHVEDDHLVIGGRAFSYVIPLRVLHTTAAAVDGTAFFSLAHAYFQATHPAKKAPMPERA